MATRTKVKEPEDLVGVTYAAVRDLIVRGRLAPGTRIVEADVAARLNVSRTPVRSALQRLQQEGYIVVAPGRRQSRALVAPLTKDDAYELFGIVGEVEGLAARWAAQKPESARGALLKRLNRINDELLECARQKPPNSNGIFDLDSSFHRRYVEAGAGPRLLALHDAVKPQAERYVRLYISFLVDRIGDSVEEHAATSRAIEAGDPDGAQHAVQVNWRHAAERLAGVIDSLGERGSW